MNYFPIFANLAGRPVLVVGGGSVAARKISLLLDAGAQVRVVANQLNAELSALAAENKILWLAEEFRAEHIRTVFLIIAASSDQALNRRVFHLAESCQKPVNVVDDRDHCSFIFPSVIDRNPVQIAVSSSGSAPVLARLLRERLEALLPPSLGDMAEISGRWRDAVKGKLKSVTERRRFWEKQFNGRFATLVKNRQNTLAERELAGQLEQSRQNDQGGSVSLVGASQLDFGAQPLQLLPQTKRHSAILRQLNCPHIVVAVNKMDLLDYSEDKFNAIVEAYRRLAEQLGLKDAHFVPVSALLGDNLVYPGGNMPWYRGEPLLAILENLPGADETGRSAADFYFPVQLVVRQDADKADDFRGYQGRIERGSVAVGQTVRIEPNGLTAEVSEIITPKGEVAQAFAGEAATLRLDRDIDVSRGDLFVDKNSPLAPQKHLEVTLCWFDERPLNTARKYLLKHGTQTVSAKVGEIESVLDVRTLEQEAGAESLKMNDIAKVRINLQKPVTATPYAENTAAGSFILIDEATYGTVAAGMIL